MLVNIVSVFILFMCPLVLLFFYLFEDISFLVFSDEFSKTLSEDILANGEAFLKHSEEELSIKLDPINDALASAKADRAEFGVWFICLHVALFFILLSVGL